MEPRETIPRFDRYLVERGLSFEAVVIGGTALALLSLAPTSDELQHITSWLQEQDGHPDWPAHVRATLADLGGRLGHGV